MSYLISRMILMLVSGLLCLTFWESSLSSSNDLIEKSLKYHYGLKNRVCSDARNYRLTFQSEGLNSMVPVPSMWQGVAYGNINGHEFRLPMKISIQRKLVDENNPFNLSISIGNQAEIGSAILSSALVTYTPYSGRQLTLQYFQVYSDSDGFRATLTNTQKQLGAVGNFFTSPNISAQTAPSIMRDIYKSLGNENFYFSEKTKFVCEYSAEGIRGILQGNGHSVSGIFPTGTVTYFARFMVRRQ